MTVSDLHDALTLLPEELVAATDALRTAPKPRTLRWMILVPMAACLALLLSAGLMLRSLPVMGSPAKSDITAQAPAAMAPVPEMKYDDSDMEAAQAAPAENGAPAEPAPAGSGIDHSHRFAPDSISQETPAADTESGQVHILADGAELILTGSDAAMAAGILEHLDYDPNAVCRCDAPITVDTPQLTGIQLNLTEGFARCDLGQASLTEDQAAAIQELLDRLT